MTSMSSRATRPVLILVGVAIGALLSSESGGDLREVAHAADVATQQETPIGPKWWPSKWGADDQRGAANLMSPVKVLEATELIKTGKVYQLGRVYERDMPTFPHRTFRLTIPAFRGVRGENRQFGRDEFFVGEIGQMGTQMDGLGHVGVGLPEGNTFYNGLTSADIEEPYGLTKLGVENAGVFFTRGVLVDVVGYRKIDRLPVGYEITLADLRGALDRQRLTNVSFARTGRSVKGVKAAKFRLKSWPQ